MKSNSDSMFSKSRRKRKSSPFSFKLFFPMILLAVLQLGTFLGTLFLGGEFSYIKEYAYNVLIEKTENRKNYVENMLTGNTELVYETNLEINNMVEQILEEEKLTYEDISKNKELNKKILFESSESLIYLLRRSMVNDVFMILDTGSLYDEKGKSEKAGLYIRDMDTAQSKFSNNKDLLMEMGNSEIAQDLGITLDYEWSSRMNVSEDSGSNFDFYFHTLETARNNQDSALYDLGYWSGFSGISSSAQKSMKYTLPLIANDGTVYGVIGIGYLEKTILKNMPANDFFSESACYILGADFDESNQYSVVLHSGSIFTRLVNEDTMIGRQNKIEEALYDFNKGNKLKDDSVGNIQDINIYNDASPYKNQHWALISIADKTQILAIYTGLIKMFVISSAISVCFSIIAAIFINKRITAPVTKIIHTLDSNMHKNEIINFDSSSITEIDRLADAITELQINVKEQSSQVSKIISMVDIGIGVFMYNFSTDSVFVGESLIKLLGFDSLPPEDTTISFEMFQKYISNIDKSNQICNSTLFNENHSNTSETVSIDLFSPKQKNRTAKWFKFNLTRDKKNVIGLVQDVTKSVIEKKKIEYERDYDVTTGLLNRRAYYKRLDEAFCSPTNLKIAAFVMWDLDNLKYVNDTYGHDFGDDYIKTAANVFKLFRDYGGIVSRLSGDEFNVFLSGFDSKEEIRKIIYNVREKLLKSYCILADGTHYKIRASGGIAWYPDDSLSYEMLMKYADFAMYTMKHSIKGNISEFDKASYNKDSILITGVEEMNRIIDEKSIKYAFQTIVSAKTGEIYGYEALMRPQSEVFKSPLELIRIARTGAKLYEIERLTWLLGLRCFREQLEKGNIPMNAKIFINSLSNCIMKEEDLQIFESENKDFLDRIVLEMLESEKVNDDYTKEKQKLVAKWNAMSALDDFGSGYNSEYALITWNPNIIKIDRSIVSGCDSDISRSSIISNLVQIASTKNILVLAEGVETYNEMKTVIGCGVDLLQGFYFHRPLFEPRPLEKRIINEIRELNDSYN